eukprot:gene19759-21692_t
MAGYVPRERNEHGLFVFFENLRRLFNEISELPARRDAEPDHLLAADFEDLMWSRMLEAKQTLLLLRSNTEGDLELTSFTNLLDMMLSSIDGLENLLHKESDEDPTMFNISFHCHTRQTGNRGRPLLIVQEEQIEFLRTFWVKKAVLLLMGDSFAFKPSNSHSGNGQHLDGAPLFYELEDLGILDVLNDVHVFALHKVFIPMINNCLKEFCEQMNHRPLSTERNRSPLQLFTSGILSNMHSGSVAIDSVLNPEVLENYGVDPNSFAPEESEYQVSIPDIHIHLTEEQEAFLENQLGPVAGREKNTYIRCLDILENVLANNSEQ